MVFVVSRPVHALRILKSSSSSVLRQNVRSMTVLSKQSAEEYKKQNYTARMEKTGRPVSPHVTIYSFPIAALTSIANRVTGMTLSIGAFGVGAMELLCGSGSTLELCQTLAASDSSMLPLIVKGSVAFPFWYHYSGGLRHLYWDRTPEILTIADVEKASYAMVGGSILLTGVSVLM